MGIKEETFYEGGPHIGDLIFHLFLAIFIVFIPLTVGSIVRAIWLRYKITDRRLSVIGGWTGKPNTTKPRFWYLSYKACSPLYCSV